MSGKLKYWFLRFYLRPFLTFFAFFWIIVYLNTQKHFMTHAGMLIFLVVGLTFLLGTAHLFLDKFFFPAEFEKLVEKKPFRNFISRGFCVANGYLNGKLDDYQVLLGYNIDANRNIRKLFANIVFKPKISGQFMTEDQLDLLNAKYAAKELSWSINSLDIEFNFEGKPPRFELILAEIEEGIAILKKEGFAPSTLADSYQVEKEIWDALLME